MAKTVACLNCGDDNAEIFKKLKCSACGAEHVFDEENQVYFLKNTKCDKCGSKNPTLTKNKRCDKCGAEYVFNKKYNKLFPKVIKCKKCHEESGTITEHNVCDKCGTVYVYDVVGVSVFISKWDFFPAGSIRYAVVRSYYNYFMAKVAGVILLIPFGLGLLLEGREFALAGIPLLLGGLACAYSLYKGYKKGGLRGFLGIKIPTLQKKGLEIKKRAEQKLASKKAG